MKSSRPRSGGFTLIELMLVVGIIGLLAAIALPAYQDYLVRSRSAEALVLAGPAQSAVAEYYDRWGRMPADNAAAGLYPPQAWRGSYVRAMRVAQGMIEVDMSPVGSTSGYTLFLRPATSKANPTAPLLWICNAGKAPPGFEVHGSVRTSQAPPGKYLPAICR